MPAITQVQTNQETKSEGGYGQHLIQSSPQIIGALIVGLIVGFAVGRYRYILAGRRDAANRMIAAEDEFFAVIHQQRSKLETMKYDEELFFAESIPVLSTAVHKMRRVYGAYRWRCLHRVLKEYQAQDKGEFGKGRARTLAAFEGKKSHSERLNDWLDKFEDTAKNAPAV